MPHNEGTRPKDGRPMTIRGNPLSLKLPDVHRLNRRPGHETHLLTDSKSTITESKITRVEVESTRGDVQVFEPPETGVLEIRIFLTHPPRKATTNSKAGKRASSKTAARKR